VLITVKTDSWIPFQKNRFESKIDQLRDAPKQFYQLQGFIELNKNYTVAWAVVN
jgi:hypothetical protein